MSAVGLASAAPVDLLAIAGPILLAARIYERAILSVGAPVKLHRMLASRTHQAETADLATAHARLTPSVDLGRGLGCDRVDPRRSCVPDNSAE